MEQALTNLIQQYLEETRLKAIAAYAGMYDCPPDEVECQLVAIGSDSPTVEWACWRHGSFHISEYGQLDLGLTEPDA